GETTERLQASHVRCYGLFHRLREQRHGVGDGSRPSSLRVNTRSLPDDRHQGKKVWTRGPSWLPSAPLSPGDALDAGRADTRRPLRPPPLTSSHHRGWLTPLLAVATAGRERAAPHAASRHGR